MEMSTLAAMETTENGNYWLTNTTASRETVSRNESLSLSDSDFMGKDIDITESFTMSTNSTFSDELLINVTEASIVIGTKVDDAGTPVNPAYIGMMSVEYY